MIVGGGHLNHIPGDDVETLHGSKEPDQLPRRKAAHLCEAKRYTRKKKRTTTAGGKVGKKNEQKVEKVPV